MADRKNSNEERLNLTPGSPIGMDAASPVECDEPRDLSRHLQTTNRRRQFAGILLSGIGISILLFLAVGLVEQFKFVDLTSLPVVATLLLLGFVTIGAGFGIMMSAAPGFDDDEFDRFLSGEEGRCLVDERQVPCADNGTDDSELERSVDGELSSSNEHNDPRVIVKAELVDS